MTSVLSIPSFLRFLFAGVLVVLFTTSCSKHADDCSAPAKNDQNATTRMAIGGGEEAGKDEKPAAMNQRGVEASGEDTNGDGISDDGDDEADGEGNKKGRAQH